MSKGFEPWVDGTGIIMTLSTSFFSTALKQVTGFFDRHGLVSAFFPNLIFWGVTLCLILGELFGWQGTLKAWEGYSGTLQALSVIGFFIWVTFFALLTVNFQSSLIRLYEGYWPSLGDSFFSQKVEKQRRRYQRQWAQWKREDAELEQQQISIIQQQRLLSQPMEQLSGSAPDASVLGDFLSAEESLLAALKPIELVPLEPGLGSPNGSAFIAAPLPTVLSQAATLQQQRCLWQQGQSLSVTQPEKQQWAQHKQTIERLTQQQKSRLSKCLGEVEENRHRLNRQQFLYFPTRPDDILPTQLGNVMRAAELYSQERYNIDAVLIWPRLQSFLPEGFAGTLQDAKTALDLMITLSAFCLIFGLPLSLWLGFRADIEFLVIAPFCITVLTVAMRQWGLCLGAFLATLLSSSFGIFPTTRILPLVRLNVLLTLGISILWVSRLSYDNAVQAALSYGEQLKAAFDLYRWKALEGLNLKLPNDLNEERALWDEICGLLYRGYSDGLAHYQYCVDEDSAHLETVSLGLDPVSLHRRTIVGIPATPAMVFGGALDMGERIKLCFEDARGAPQSIEDVLVLKVSAVEVIAATGDPGTINSYVIKAAIEDSEVGKWWQRRSGGAIAVFMA